MSKTKKAVKKKLSPGKPALKKKAPKKSAGSAAGKILAGSALPAFSLPSTGGKTISSAMLKGRPVVLYFYPRDATPGCTIEGHDFSKLKNDFKLAGAEVFGISRDTIKSHEKFKACENYTIDLLSDEDESVCKLFGVIKMKNMYGKQVRGIERSTFVIDRDGKIAKEWRGVKVPGHAEEVLGFVRAL